MYFMDGQMDLLKQDPALSRFVNAERLEQFRGFGGVRIEDVVVVRKDGIENFTQTPRSVEEVCCTFTLWGLTLVGGWVRDVCRWRCLGKKHGHTLGMQCSEIGNTTLLLHKALLLHRDTEL